MILTKVILQDYGVYKGKNEFDFSCTDEKPVVLIGGTNGAGKTTLFESIMLCLYGMSTMGKKTTQKTYHKFLARKVHRYLNSATSADYASIVVQFKFSHNRKETEYRVARTWTNDNDDVEENLVIKKRHADDDEFEPLDMVEESQWQSFVEDLIPRGIVKLFFFDGEKIVKIAKEGKEDLAIRDSFKSLLGIELVEQLKTDLQVNLVRHLTSGGKSLQERFEKLKAEKEENLNLVGRLQERLAQKQNELDSNEMGIEAMEKKISKLGGGYADKRDDAKTQLTVKTETYEITKKRMQEMCAGPTPFCLISDILDAVSGQIMHDTINQRDRDRAKILKITAGKVDTILQKEEFWSEFDVEKHTRQHIREKISELIKDDADSGSQEVMFGLSQQQTSEIHQTVKASDIMLDNFKKEAENIGILSEEISELHSIIARAPDDDEIGPLMSKIGKANKFVGELRAEMNHIEEQISSAMAMNSHIDVNIREIVAQMYRDDKAKTSVELTQKMQAVLEEFVENLKAKKIHLLEQYTLDALHTLLHKQDFIEKIVINPETFEVTLYRKNNDPLPKDILSEGEKQMFATAILWALAKTSGRPLPFMIDTPLARLDESHRTNIVEKFFPFASHQILIFSTDKEIEYEHYEKLKPYMSHSYAMEYIHGDGATKKHDVYFWNKKGEKIVAF